MRRVIKTIFSIIIQLTVILTFISSCFCFRNNSDSTYAEQNCHIKKQMDYYLSREFGLNQTDQKCKASEMDKKISYNENFAAYFRFLSIVSGIESPFNYEPKHILNNSYELSHDYRNIKLVKWYLVNKRSVSCNLLNEYYQIEQGLIHGPLITSYDDDLHRQIESYGDSVFDRLRTFKMRHSPLIALGDTTVLQEENYTKEPVLLKQIEWTDSQILNQLLNNLVKTDKTKSAKISSYSADIKLYKGQQLVRIVKYGDVYSALLYSDNGYDGYILIQNTPVIISAHESLRLHYNDSVKNKEFRMLSKYHPFSFHLNDKRFFLLSDNEYTEIAYRTGVDLWNEIILLNEREPIKSEKVCYNPRDQSRSLSRIAQTK